jgi:hypothetical protein
MTYFEPNPKEKALCERKEIDSFMDTHSVAASYPMTRATWDWETY